jgi:chromate transport protein ChrA
MSLLYVVAVLIVIGVLLWATNKFGSEFIDGKILKIINIVVIVVVVLWVLGIFFDWRSIGNVRVPTFR